MQTSRRTPSLIAASAAAALALAGCGSSSSTSTTAATPTSTPAPAAQGAAGPAAQPSAAASGPAASNVPLSADPTGALKFNVTTLHAKAGSVTLTMSNPASSGVPHGISVQGNGVDKDSAVVQAGATATVTATLKPGTYTFYCPVPGHEAAGMKGTLVVA